MAVPLLTLHLHDDERKEVRLERVIQFARIKRNPSVDRRGVEKRHDGLVADPRPQDVTSVKGRLLAQLDLPIGTREVRKVDGSFVRLHVGEQWVKPATAASVEERLHRVDTRDEDIVRVKGRCLQDPWARVLGA